MAKYRILEIPQFNKGAKYRIETWGTIYKWGVFWTSSYKGWVWMDSKGGPVVLCPDGPICYDLPPLFKTHKAARVYIDAIIEYKNKQPKVVFETEA